jgi:hypothetical protein
MRSYSHPCPAVLLCERTRIKNVTLLWDNELHLADMTGEARLNPVSKRNERVTNVTNVSDQSTLGTCRSTVDQA